ncbi:flagellar biosynthetic protein FliO [Rheinheimera sp. YQF-2]|uniref:Flagellar protein n=1 Tax=Rheinheimera lutimaris TaxID=2740584 RepID=A0A7Y5APS8_9GAMM|nr:flagellar biosynthetic protein FliO [Rheinheimera lutimaris]NRQ42288.1 flagellar biosynthetic protein FliO [Rheinheimera lutimaris]
MRIFYVLSLSLALLAGPVAAGTSDAVDNNAVASEQQAESEPKTEAALQPGSVSAAEAKAGTEPVKPADAGAQNKIPALSPKTETGDGERPSAGLGLGKMALSLAIVVAIVIALGWAFKKLTLRMPGSRHIKIISSMPLGPKERLLVIEMQGKQRVLGVTANSINLLFELENSLPEEKLASDFHTQLQSLLKK